MSKLLLITSDALLARAYRGRLEHAGCEVAWEPNADAGLLKARRWQPELIVLDLLLPGLSGLDVIKWLRDVPWLVQVPVVLLIERTAPAEVLAECRRWGVTAHVPKDQLSLEDATARILRAAPTAAPQAS